MILNSFVFYGSGSATVEEFLLTFDDISVVDSIIGGNKTLVADWNTFFNSVTGTPFTSVEIIGNVVNLKGGTGITLSNANFTNERHHLIKVEDILGCVVAVGNGVFAACGSLTTCKLPSATSFGNYAFEHCHTLTVVNFNSLITAGDACFNSCDLLNDDCRFPKLTTVGEYCFATCIGLINPDFSQLITAGYQSFAGIGMSLESPNFSSLEIIGGRCFQGSDHFWNLDFPKLKTVADGGFIDCTAATIINLPSLVTLGVYSEQEVFTGITGNVITLTVPEIFMTNGPGGAVERDINLLAYQQNNIVTIYTVGLEVGQGFRLAFDDIANASTFIDGDATSLIDWNYFFNFGSGTPFTSIEVYDTNTINLLGGSGLTLGFGKFTNCTSLLLVSDASGAVVTIEDEVFYGCTNLKHVHFAACDTIEFTAGGNNYYDCAFGMCSNLTTVNMPKLSIIGAHTFEFCESLVNITFDFANITELGEYTFLGCTLLTDTCVNKFVALTTAGDCCFQGCTGLTTPDFSALTTAGDYCFYSCTGLTTSDFSALTTAGTGCFQGCTGLTTSDFSALTTAGAYCFYSCTGLTTSDFSALTTAGAYCFSGCTGLISINLSSLTAADTSLGDTSGDDNVFNGITSKTITITIPVYFETNNSGGMDGDLAYLNTNNTLTILHP